MMNLISILDSFGDTGELCNSLKPVLRIVGYVVLLLKIAVPIILIVIGISDLMKATTEKKDDKIKEAQTMLVKRIIAAVLVFLVATLVGVVMQIVGHEEYKDCMQCINHPFDCPAVTD